MERERFDSAAYRQEKYGDKKLEFLTPTEHKTHLKLYKEIINKTIVDIYKRWGYDEYGISGIAIVGSFARGEAHKESDLDIITLSERDQDAMVEVREHFVEKLKQNNLEIKVDNSFGHICLIEQREHGVPINQLKEIALDGELLIFTPYPHIKTSVKKLLQNW